jgi:DNA-binding transcriptional LysR family regulator
MAMELRHLRYFIAVAEEANISRAAERLGIQQPPLSQQIKAIQRELNAQLFRRKARGIELTEAGRALLDEARATIAQFDHAVKATQRTARGEQGGICVGVTATAPFHPFVPRVIRAFREAFPLVALTLEECLSDELMERLRKERMDAAFIRTSVLDLEGLVINPLLEERMVVALPSEHMLTRNDGGGDAAISLKRLAGETFILYGPPKTGMFMDATITACRMAGFSPRVGQQAPRITSTLSLIAAGLGISLVPASLQRMNMDGVTYRRLAGTIQPKAVLNLASRRGDTSNVLRQFLTLVKRAAKNLD